MDIRGCIEKRFLAKIKPAPDLVKKELGEADYDYESAEKAFSDKDWKWAIVKSYYCMFHAARAVLFKLGLKETRHFAIGVVLEDLSKKGKLESKFVNYFNAAVSSREDADYHYSYSEDTAEHTLEIAEDFLK
ncbi:MAG: HEPN domain-containing protein [Nanoarchaeota archaeon]|nr:HEPN domain-containing protein [Nanoarchaeota archaeon]